MPIIQSAKKALRQNIKRRAKNLIQKKNLKQAIKTYKKLIAAKNMDEAKKQLSLVYQTLDKAGKTHLIKKNTASRLKSRLTKALNKKV